MIIDFHCHIGKGVRKSLKPGDLIKKWMTAVWARLLSAPSRKA
ncbi:MAG: hypothetical protein SVV80_02595 [Planctomycetota bacterium]|nr:hypothetical protein [Planctomycetota bacterium]